MTDDKYTDRLRKAVDDVYAEKKDPLWLKIIGPLFGVLIITALLLGLVWLVTWLIINMPTP